MNMNIKITTCVIRKFYDKEKTKLKEEYFICDGKKEKIYIKYLGMGN